MSDFQNKDQSKKIFLSILSKKKSEPQSIYLISKIKTTHLGDFLRAMIMYSAIIQPTGHYSPVKVASNQTLGMLFMDCELMGQKTWKQKTFENPPALWAVSFLEIFSLY